MERSIPAKLHLGDRSLTSDIITYGTVSIGDWAYAHCSALRSLALPDTVQEFGKDIFLGCDRLEYVYCFSDTDFSFDTLPADKEAPLYWLARLNALALRYFPAPAYLLACGKNGYDTGLKSWDDKCFEYLDSSDDKGFKPFLAGGEEDYSDNDEQWQSHIKISQQVKARIIYTRLLSVSVCGLPIDNDLQDRYLEAFRNNPEAVALLNDIDSHYPRTAGIYAKAGLLTAQTLPCILDRTDPHKVELRSALINGTGDTILSNLSLVPDPLDKMTKGSDPGDTLFDVF